MRSPGVFEWLPTLSKWHLPKTPPSPTIRFQKRLRVLQPFSLAQGVGEEFSKLLSASKANQAIKTLGLFGRLAARNNELAFISFPTFLSETPPNTEKDNKSVLSFPHLPKRLKKTFESICWKSCTLILWCTQACTLIPTARVYTRATSHSQFFENITYLTPTFPHMVLAGETLSRSGVRKHRIFFLFG